MATHEEFEAEVWPIFKKLHEVCARLGVPLFMIAEREEGCAMGTVMMTNEGCLLPKTQRVRIHKQIHEGSLVGIPREMAVRHPDGCLCDRCVEVIAMDGASDGTIKA